MPNLATLSQMSDTERWDANAAHRLAELAINDDPAYRALRNKIREHLDSLGVGPGATILDVGCGLGFLTRALHDDGFRIIGIDPSERSIEIARSVEGRASDLFLVSDLEDFAEVHSGTKFDVIVANMVLHCASHIQSFMAAAARLLADDGFLVTTIPNPKTYLQSRDDIDSSLINFAVEQRLEIPFRIRNHPAHPVPVVFYHRPLRIYSVAGDTAHLRIHDYETPEHIGPGRPRDVSVLTFAHQGTS